MVRTQHFTAATRVTSIEIKGSESVYPLEFPLIQSGSDGDALGANKEQQLRQKDPEIY
jgi:hypothetical protein